MKQSGKKLLTMILVIVFLFSAGMFLKQQLAYASGNDSYTEALALATSHNEPAKPTLPAEVPTEPELTWVPAPVEEEDPHIQTLEEMDLEALRAVNPDVIGWILIPDTKINYPLMQGTDNDFYLKHTWDGKSNGVGSIFLEYMNLPDLADFNTIVYGHNMSNGSMFAGIRQYANQTFWDAHPYIYVRRGQEVYRYEVFSSYLADVDSFTYDLLFSTEEAREQFIASTMTASVIPSDVQPEVNDRILTLSTCSGRGYSTRWVVHARLKMIQVQASD